MKTCEYAGDARALLRSHPWTHAESNSEFRYYDVRKSPALIRTALEDFVPFGHYPAIDHFYALLEPTSPSKKPSFPKDHHEENYLPATRRP